MSTMLKGRVWEHLAPDGECRPYLSTRIPFPLARQIFDLELYIDPDLVQAMADRIEPELKQEFFWPDLHVCVEDCRPLRKSHGGQSPAEQDLVDQPGTGRPPQATVALPAGRKLTLTSGGVLFQALEMCLDRAEAKGDHELAQRIRSWEVPTFVRMPGDVASNLPLCPDRVRLESRLLSLYGMRVVFFFDPYIDFLLKRGQLFPTAGLKKCRVEDQEEEFCTIESVLRYATDHVPGPCEVVWGYRCWGDAGSRTAGCGMDSASWRRPRWRKARGNANFNHPPCGL